MRPVQLPAQSAVGPGPLVVLDYRAANPVTTVNVVNTPGAALTYSVEVTTDDVFNPAYNPLTGSWVAHPSANLTGASTTQAAVTALPFTAARLNVTAYTSGSAGMKVICAGGRAG